MNYLFTFTYKDRHQLALDTKQVLGERLEGYLEDRGINISLPTNADWGYVFRAQLRKFSFDIIIKHLNEKNLFGLSVSSTLDWLQKLIKTDDNSEQSGLCRILFDILTLQNEFDDVLQYSEDEWQRKFSKPLLDI